MNQKTAHILFSPIIFILLCICYYDVIFWMYGRWTSVDSYYSHGFLIPFISGYLIWIKKDHLCNEPMKGSYWGLGLIMLSLIIHCLGTILYVFSISGFSIFLILFGISLFIYGKKITKEILFPLSFLFFMFPLPIAVINKISFPMKQLVAKTGVAIVGFMGIPIFREGFHITIPAGNLLVENPCSGLRSLISFLALGAIFSYVSKISPQGKIILFFVSIPIAIASNIIRVPLLILISHYWGLEYAAPDSFLHSASGILVFVVGIFLLLLVGRVLAWKTLKSDI